MSEKALSNLPLTIIVPVRNEESNIADCLKSVQWANQVFVVDSNSEDNTAALAQSLGAEVVQFRYDGGWPKKKNWAIRNLPINNDWIMILDADERISDELAAEICEAIQRTDINGYYVRWKFVFLGRWMRHCWSNNWMLRIVRKGTGEYEDLGMRGEGGWDNEVHENLLVTGKTGLLKNWLTHDLNEMLSYWLKKHNEFSDWGAAHRDKIIGNSIPPISSLFSREPVERRKYLKAIYIRMPFKPLILFIYLYIFKLGILDGKAGSYFCALRACHELSVEAKCFERKIQ